MSQQSSSLPVLFTCTRLHTKLTVINCARRWQLAQDGETKPESLDVCRACEVGKQHALSSATPENDQDRRIA